MAGTTTNFGFDYPTSTDYVKDGATAIQELADDVDARFGDDANYPDQIVNVVSGVSRPVPFATQGGSVTISYAASVTGDTAVTFAAGRFTQAPLIVMCPATNSLLALRSLPSAISSTTSGFTARIYYTTGVNQTGSIVVQWQAFQMKSATAAG